jgi:hypothetical protein
VVIEGILEMVDFRPADHKCRIKPIMGDPVPCAFKEDQESDIERFIRKPVRVKGRAFFDPHTEKIDLVEIEDIEGIQPILLGSHEFYNPKSFQDLVKQQNVRPLANVKTLSGAFMEADKLDELLEEIYSERM